MHFNENSERPIRASPGGTPIYNVSYRKYKGGKATVKTVKVAPSYSKPMNNVYNGNTILTNIVL